MFLFTRKEEKVSLYRSEWITCKDCHSNPDVNKSQVREAEQVLFKMKLKEMVDNALETNKDFRFPYAFFNDCYKGTAVVVGKPVRYSTYPRPLEALVKRITGEKEFPTSDRELKAKINEWADFFSTCLEMYFAAKADGGRPFGTKEARESERSKAEDSKRSRFDEEA